VLLRESDRRRNRSDQIYRSNHCLRHCVPPTRTLNAVMFAYIGGPECEFVASLEERICNFGRAERGEMRLGFVRTSTVVRHPSRRRRNLPAQPGPGRASSRWRDADPEQDYLKLRLHYADGLTSAGSARYSETPTVRGKMNRRGSSGRAAA